MNAMWRLVMWVAVVLTVNGRLVAETNEMSHAGAAQAIFTEYREFKWDKILPDLGADSPEICIVHVDPKTQATKLMIRIPKGIHVRRHWHSANETHTILAGKQVYECDGKRVELGPGSFNYLPAKMVHEAGCRRDHSRSSRWTERGTSLGWTVLRRPAIFSSNRRGPTLRLACRTVESRHQSPLMKTALPLVAARRICLSSRYSSESYQR